MIDTAAGAMNPLWIRVTQPLPEDAMYERQMSAANAYDFWIKAHRWNTFWHRRFGQGYCHKCQEGTSA